jgi:hypothetical protein
MCGELEDAKHVTLCSGRNAGWRMNLKCTEWLDYNEFIIKKIINCNKIFLKDNGNYLAKV